MKVPRWKRVKLSISEVQTRGVNRGLWKVREGGRNQADTHDVVKTQGDDVLQ